MKQLTSALVLLFIFCLTHTSTAQHSFEFGSALQIKKGFIYKTNSTSNAPDLFSFKTDAFNLQLDLITTYRTGKKINVYSGLSLGYSSNICNFRLNENTVHISGTYEARTFSYKVPLKVGYMLNNRIEALLGVSYNLSATDLQRSQGSAHVSQIESYEADYDLSFSKFSTFSANAGVQFHATHNLSLFTLFDFDFGKYPASSISVSYKIAGKPEVHYSQVYRPQLYMLSVGIYFRLFGGNVHQNK